MIQVRSTYHPLHFRKPVRTSRNVLTSKPTWFIELVDPESKESGIGEVSIIEGLSLESRMDIEGALQRLIAGETPPDPELFKAYPALRFALELAQASLREENSFQLFNTPFSKGELPIPINGLVWMNKADEMLEEARQKIADGFHCMKFKVGALDFKEELQLLETIRKEFGDQVEIRVDANGGFTDRNPLEKLKILSQFHIHSIEQPIVAGRTAEMAKLVQASPIPIALDEELIGIHEMDAKLILIQTIQPQYVILKPSLIGGWKASEEWIHVIEEHGGSWWATSALESNIGLNAIAQWVSGLSTTLPQGLGTGKLYTNNIGGPLEIRSGELWTNQANWTYPQFD